jgi:predicted amidophosphoribosyltransferase
VLDHRARKKNLEDAFAVQDILSENKCVLIVDDIFTTGNTINSMARVLREHGAQKVFFLTISIGQGF